jgi:uncharacterized protein YrzB (UPF0473 family)
MAMDYDMEEEKVTIERDGRTIECDVLFTFDCEDTMKSYIGYTDHSIASNGRKNIYVSSYDPFKPVLQLENVTDEKELRMIHEVLQRLDQSVE